MSDGDNWLIGGLADDPFEGSKVFGFKPAL